MNVALWITLSLALWITLSLALWITLSLTLLITLLGKDCKMGKYTIDDFKIYFKNYWFNIYN